MSLTELRPPQPSEVMLNDAYFVPQANAFTPEENHRNRLLKLQMFGTFMPLVVTASVEQAATDARTIEQTYGTLEQAAETATNGLVAVVLDSRYKARKGKFGNYDESKIVSPSEFDDQAAELTTPYFKTLSF